MVHHLHHFYHTPITTCLTKNYEKCCLLIHILSPISTFVKKIKNLDTISNYMMKLHVTISVTGMRTRQNGVTVWDGFMVQSQKMW